MKVIEEMRNVRFAVNLFRQPECRKVRLVSTIERTAFDHMRPR